MAHIGGVSCDLVKGALRNKKERVDVWQTPGFDDYGAQALGLGDSEFQFTGVYFDSSANVETWFANIEALQGAASSITIVDDWDATYSGLLITGVSMPRKTARVNHDGNGVCRGQITVRGIVL